jgi:D-threo-aldose 1-dehydrogenase
MTNTEPIDPRAVRRLGRSGLTVSQLGFGCSAMGVLRPGEDEAAATAAMASAWGRGLRYFDTSPWYGRGLSEHRTGAFLRHVPRAGYLLSTKVGRLLHPLPPDAAQPADTLPFGARFDYSYDATLRSVEDSLQRLGLSRVDMLILHDLSPRWHGDALERQFAIAMQGAQRALCDLRSQGVVKAIGVGVNDVDVCKRCLQAGDFDFFMLAGRLTLLDHAAALPLLAACAQRGVSVLAAAPFNSGILATGATASARFFYAPAPAEIAARTPP